MLEEYIGRIAVLSTGSSKVRRVYLRYDMRLKGGGRTTSHDPDRSSSLHAPSPALRCLQVSYGRCWIFAYDIGALCIAKTDKLEFCLDLNFSQSFPRPVIPPILGSCQATP